MSKLLPRVAKKNQLNIGHVESMAARHGATVTHRPGEYFDYKVDAPAGHIWVSSGLPYMYLHYSGHFSVDDLIDKIEYGTREE